MDKTKIAYIDIKTHRISLDKEIFIKIGLNDIIIDQLHVLIFNDESPTRGDDQKDFIVKQNNINRKKINHFFISHTTNKKLKVVTWDSFVDIKKDFEDIIIQDDIMCHEIIGGYLSGKEAIEYFTSNLTK